MKRKLNYLFSIFLVGLVTNIFAQSSQLRNWALPQNNQVKFTITSANVSPLPTGGPSGYNFFAGVYGDVAHNTMHDSNGDLLFYIAENSVYDKDGDLIGPLTTDPLFYNNGNQYLTPEISIVPDIASGCTKFYIVCGFKSDLNFYVDYKPHYAILDMTLQNPNFPSNPAKKGSLQTNSLMGTLFAFPSAVGGAFNLHSASLHIAVSKLRTVGGTSHRFIFVADAQNIYRFKLLSSGIIYDATSAPINTSSSGSSWLRGEMELIEDVPNNKYKIAVVATRTSPGGYKIFTANLNYTTGAFISSLDINLPNPVSGPAPKPHGIEFSPDGNYLYITHETSSSLSGNIKYFNFTTSTLNNLVVTSPAAYQFSQVELGHKLLVSLMTLAHPMYFESANGLLALKNANNPASGFITTSFANNSTYLPDQIDGEVYFPTCPTLSVTGNINICAGSSSTLTASGASTYTWYPGGYVGSTYVVSPSSTTIYTVVSTQACCTSTATIKVVVNPNNLSPDFYIGGSQISPTDFTISATPVALATYPTSSFWWEICEVDATGAVVTTPPTTMTNAQTWWYAPFLSLNTFPGYNYTTPASSWPVSAPMPPSPSLYTLTNPAPGRFSYGKRYRITRATYGDCIPWTTVSKTIHACTGCKGVNGSTGFIVEDDSYSPPMPEYLITATKIENQNEIMNNDIIVSPNPTNGIFSVNMQTESLRDIYVYDVNGKIVFESKGALEKSLNVNLSNQAEGIYFIRIMDAKTSVTKKVIKQ